MNFVHKKTTEIDFFHGKVVKTNSINWKLAEIQFQVGITKKKTVLIELNSMRLTSVTGRFWEKARVYDFLRNRFHWLKFRGYRFDWKKSQWKPIKLIWSQSNWKSSKECSWSLFLRSKIHGNCLHQWWKKTKTFSLTGSPCETISHKCNAWKLVPLKVNPGKLIWLMEKLWKLTSSIEKPGEPISTIGNPQKNLSTFRKQWKSVASDEKFHCSIFFGERFMEEVLLISSPEKSFP